MAKRLFIGGLPYATTEDELREMFAKIGPVSTCTIIIDKFTGRSKGFGFIEFENDADADKAVKELNGIDMGGRKIVVNEARPMEDRPPRRDFHGGGGHGGDRRGGGDRYNN